MSAMEGVGEGAWSRAGADEMGLKGKVGGRIGRKGDAGGVRGTSKTIEPAGEACGVSGETSNPVEGVGDTDSSKNCSRRGRRSNGLNRLQERAKEKRGIVQLLMLE